MPFPGKQPGGGVQADPACAGQVHLAPGVQVGEVHLGAGRAVQGFDVGGELDQVAGHEPRRQPQVAQQLHQQPGRVAARAAGVRQGVLGGLHPRLHADQVADVVAQALVEGHQKVHGRQRCAVDAVQVGLEGRGQGQGCQVRRQLLAFIGAVAEGDFFRVGLKEEVEGVEHRHFRQQVDLDAQFSGFFREHQPRQVIALGVLLPVDEVLLGPHLQAIGQHPRAAVGRRAQANDLRAELDGAVVAVMRDMVQCDMNRHGVPPASLGRL